MALSDSSRIAATMTLLVAVTLHVTVASGHGRFPQAGMLAIDPSDPDRLLALTTYGMLSTLDHGARWDWICAESIGYDADLEDPVAAISADGSIAVGVFDGLSVSASDGCDWQFAAGDLANRYFVDVVSEQERSSLIALSSNGVGAGVFAVDLWGSTDNGSSWAQMPTAGLPADFLGVSLGIALSDDQRLYLSGRDGPVDATLEGVVYRSDDRGANWTRWPVPGTTERRLPYIAGTDPTDPDTIYLALIETEGAATIYFGLLHSADGGQNWQVLLERNHAMAGFALSPDGKKVALGGEESGLLIADVGAWNFEQKNELRVRCLTWSERGLYACADQFVDGFSLGLSEDGGASFSVLMELSSACGPPSTCGPESSTGNACVKSWPAERLELGATDCDETPDPADPTSSGSGCRWAARGMVPALRQPRDPTGALGGLMVVAMLGLFRYRSRRRSRRRRPVRA